MKRNVFLLSLIIVFLSACTNPKETAQKLLSEFSEDLKQIQNPQDMSIYNLDKHISRALYKLNRNRDKELSEFSNNEDIKLFNNFFKIETVKEYNDLINILTERNLNVINEIKDKYWIETNTKHHYSIFKISSNDFSFLNLKNKFNYKIVNGNILCDNIKLFLEIKSDHLYLIDENGKTKEFEKASIKHKLLGKWKKYGTSGGQYNGIGYVFKKNGKGVDYGYSWDMISYSMVGNKIKIVKKCSYGDYKETCIYVNRDKIKHEFGAEFYRLRFKGPHSISYLINGDYEHPNEKSIKIEHSNATTNNNRTKDWDKILDDYEDYVNEYIKFYKKAMSGDMSALEKYPELLEKAEELEKSLQKAQDNNNLSSSQIKRISNIQNKIINAIN